MRYEEVQPAVFLTRPNRFIAHVLLQGQEVVCHVKNTGRCRELLRPGVQVWLEKGRGAKRKTAWDLIAVQKGERLVNMDAQAPNRAFGEWARNLEPGIVSVRPEVFFEDSRLDFLLETERGKHYVEVKGVTLESGGHVYFPDAPTERGVRHLHTLTRAVEQGYRATVFFRGADGGCAGFCTQRRDAPGFWPGSAPCGEGGSAGAGFLLPGYTGGNGDRSGDTGDFIE